MSDLKFKVGDRVCVNLKGTIIDVDGRDTATLPYQVEIYDNDNVYYDTAWVREKTLSCDNSIDKLFDEFSNVIYRITDGDLTDLGKRMDIFGYNDIYGIITCLKPAEILSRVRKYDIKHAINVGDVVTNPNFGTGVVIEVDEETDKSRILAKNGKVRLGFSKSSLTKTGRTIDISKILKELNKEE